MKKRRSRRRSRKKRHHGRRSRRRSRRRKSRRRRSRKRRRGAGFNNSKPLVRRSNVKKPNDCAEEKRIIRELRKQLRGPSGGTPKSPPPRQNPFHDEYIRSPATPVKPRAARKLENYF